MNSDYRLKRSRLGECAAPALVHNRCGRSSTGTRAFSLIELLVVLAVIGVLAALLMPSLAKAKNQAQSAACMNNLKNLQAGWFMYAHTYGDSLPPNISRKVGFDQVNMAVDGRVPWVLGNAKTDTSMTNIQAGVLFPHVGSAMVYRCPAEDSRVRNQPAVARDRSYSLVSWLNCDVVSGTILDGVNDDPANLRKYSQIMAPSRIWVFIDEHQRSIDDGIFAIPRHVSDTHDQFWDSFPGDRHGNGANLSFADCHVEHHPWRFHRVNLGPGTVVASDPQDLADLRWLQQRLPP